tara:strand:+ start:650 stop:766 length:117 start_codon:yes stop_codon:yes gene_type:complete
MDQLVQQVLVDHQVLEVQVEQTLAVVVAVARTMELQEQ